MIFLYLVCMRKVYSTCCTNLQEFVTKFNINVNQDPNNQCGNGVHVISQNGRYKGPVNYRKSYRCYDCALLNRKKRFDNRNNNYAYTSIIARRGNVNRAVLEAIYTNNMLDIVNENIADINESMQHAAVDLPFNTLPSNYSEYDSDDETEIICKTKLLEHSI